MSEENQTEVRPKRESVVLNEASTEKINRWFEQINAKKKVRLSRRDFLNWFIEKSAENLSNNDLNAIVERFYDEEAFLRQLLRDVKKAKADGKTEPSLELFVRTKRPEQKKDLIQATSEDLEDLSTE